MRLFPVLACCLFLAACADGGGHEDLREWMSEASKNLKGRVKPLPLVKPYEPVAYDAGNLMDPFKPSKITPEKRQGGGGTQPDFDRPREPLEAYPLESLKYVGVMERKKQSYAIILVDGALYQVRTGNYLGQNFGVITQINETEVVLKELVQDAAGDWIERTSSLQLQGQGGVK